MANLLASCWLLVEFFVIPNGFLKWLFLSYYIHPFFLFFCQIFLWLKQVERCFLLCLCFLYRITCYMCSFLVRFAKRVAFGFDSHGSAKKVEVFYEATNHQVPSIVGEVIFKSTCIPVFEGKIDSRGGSVIDLHESMEDEDGYRKCKSSWLDEYLNSDHYNSSALLNDSDTISESDRSELSTRSLSSSSMDHEFDCETKDFEEPVDSWHQPFEGMIRSSSEILLPQSIEIQASESIVNSTMDDSLPQSAEVQSFVAVIPSAPFAPDALSTSLHEPDDFEISTPAANLSVEYEHLLTFSNSVLFLVSSEQPLVHSSSGNIRDSFHKTYTERMRFYDVLCHERLYGINAISNAYLETPSSWMSTESPVSFSSNKSTDTKMLLRSLKSDLELAYVAELCLCWEALHYQYTKVEALANPSNFQNLVLFCPDSAEKFQEFQIRFERLTEEERSFPEGKRSFGYYCKRCPLHVPDVTGLVEENNNGMRGDAIQASEVLKAIEKCINSFWTYVKADYKKWKFKSILRSHPPVEDPRDLELLYYLTQDLHKKGLLLKNLEGKRNCWLRKKVRPLRVEYETKDVIFSEIDLKLTGKVLKLSIISSSHLRWCQEKLGNIEFKDGRLLRVPRMSLFPSS